ncbi:MAG: Gfo/Idh/MocA family protein, partial [Vicinamibacteraceae bacterium]
MTNVNRRHFLMSSVALPVAMRARATASPNETVRVAVVGFNSRGESHISAYLKTPNVEIAALCDVDASVLAKGVKMVEEGGKKAPATYSDFRKVLEDSSIDAVSIATPNFHHTLQTIWACEAGKDVYVEKPCSYNMFEARQIVAASRKYNRIVQDGTGASASLHEARQRLKDGVVGDVYMARGLCFKWRDTI